MQIYVDGQLAGESKDQQGPISYPDEGVLALGAYIDDNESYTFDGALREIRLYKKALSADEVAGSRPGQLATADALEGIPVRVTLYDGAAISGVLIELRGAQLLVRTDTGSLMPVDSRRVKSIEMWPK